LGRFSSRQFRNTGLESPVNPQAGMPALPAGRPRSGRSHGLAEPIAARISSVISGCAGGVTGANTASATGPNNTRLGNDPFPKPNRTMA
jgi:hypothetical protein